MSQCYNFKNSKLSKDSDVNKFFEKQKGIVEQKMVAVHTEGLSERMDPKVLHYYRNHIENGKYHEVKYL